MKFTPTSSHRRARFFSGKNSINLLLLLLPAIVLGGLLGYYQSASIGVRLFVLSLIGIYPTLVFIQVYRVHGIYHHKTLLYGTLSVVWWLIFAVHSTVLSASWAVFDSSIDAFFIVQAVANTTRLEAMEFVQFHWHKIAFLIVLLCVCLYGYFWMLLRYFDVDSYVSAKPTWTHKTLFVLFVILCVAAYTTKPNRKNAPMFFWYNYYAKIVDFQDELKLHQRWHKRWQQQAISDIIAADDRHTQTHIIAITESLTSENFGICGYPRDTTPHISALQNELMIYCKAYSPYATTINAVKALLTDMPAGAPKFVPTQSLLTHAKQAGYQTYWISNQDDSYLSSLFGSLADVAIYHNRLSGRSSFSKDEGLLPHLHNALADTHTKKLIILHLIGAHPNYSARYPDRFERFPDDNKGADQIDAHFDRQNFGSLTRQARDEYDNSILYQDWMFAEILKQLKNDTADNQSLTFVSDHGNEVGHVKDYAGHSDHSEAGYKVPLIVWQNSPNARTGIEQGRLVDTAELNNHMLMRMGILTKSGQPLPWSDHAYQFAPKAKFPYWQNNKKTE